MGMSRKHFRKIAAIVNEHCPIIALDDMTEAFAEWLSTENRRFDADRFRAACKE